jgi:hypothetical protein
MHRKKKVREFPVPSRDVTTKLSLGGNNDVITELFLPRGSLVSDIPAGDGKLVNFFLRCVHFKEMGPNPFYNKYRYWGTRTFENTFQLKPIFGRRNVQIILRRYYLQQNVEKTFLVQYWSSQWFMTSTYMYIVLYCSAGSGFERKWDFPAGERYIHSGIQSNGIMVGVRYK